MDDNAILDVIKSYATLAGPAFRRWRMDWLRGYMADFEAQPDEAAAAYRELWRKPLGRFDNSDVAQVLDDMESGSIELPPFGEAPRAIARHARVIVDRRASERKALEPKIPGPQPGDTSPQLTPEEFRNFRRSVGNAFRAITLTSYDDYKDNTNAYQEALGRAASERRRYKAARKREPEATT